VSSHAALRTLRFNTHETDRSRMCDPRGAAFSRSSEGGRPQILKLKVYTVVKHGAVDLVLGQGTLPVDTMQNDYDFTIPLVDGLLVTGKAHIYIQVRHASAQPAVGSRVTYTCMRRRTVRPHWPCAFAPCRR
jgi:hypothetical protein